MAVHGVGRSRTGLRVGACHNGRVLPFLVTPLVLCAAVLLVSGVAKLREPQATRDAFVALRLPRRLADSPAPALLPWGELALGVLLLVGVGWVLLLATVATLLLFFGYLAVIARALGFPEKVSCNCFGKLGEQGVTRRTLVRNAVLVATASLATVAALLHVSVPATLVEATGPTLGWLAMAALTGAVALLVLGHGPADAPTAAGRPTKGSRLPWFTLLDATTRTPVHTGDLPNERTVLLFVSLGCGSCVRVLEDLDTLRAANPEVAIRPVLADTYAGDPETWAPAVRADGLLDPHGNVSQTLVEWTPTAVLVDRSGTLLADPAVGEGEVRALIASAGPQPQAPATPEPAPEPEPVAEPEPEPAVEDLDDDEFAYERTPIPTAAVIDADGEPKTMHELTAHTAALLVSINCLCGTSREAAASVNRWAQTLPQLEVRLLSSMKPESLPEEIRPDGAVAYDHAGLAQKALELSGSPVAVLLGADGLLAGGPVHGVAEIEQFVADIAEQLGEAAG